MSTEAQIAWAAGIYEGEGSICLTNSGKGRHTPTCRITVVSSDLDVLHRLAAIMQGGRINIRPTSVWGNKPCYGWNLNGNAAVERAIEAFWPWLSERRREQAEVVLGRVIYERALAGRSFP